MTGLDDLLSDNHLAAYEESLGLPAGFIAALTREGDDWSFTIKSHALIETGLTELLTHRLKEPALEDMLATLPTSGRFSKLAMGRALHLFGDDGRTERFVKTLGTLRNRIVHNIKRAVEFSLEAYFSELSAREPDVFKSQHSDLDLIFGGDEPITVDNEKTTGAELFKENPRLVIASSLGLVLIQIHYMTNAAKFAKKWRDDADALLRDIVLEGLRRAGPSPESPSKE